MQHVFLTKVSLAIIDSSDLLFLFPPFIYAEVRQQVNISNFTFCVIAKTPASKLVSNTYIIHGVNISTSFLQQTS